MSNYMSEERTRFQLRERLIAIGDDYDIRDEHGNAAFHVDGKVLRLRDTFVITDQDGQEVATIKKKLISIRETMKISRGGDTLATVRKAMFRLLRDKYVINVRGGRDLSATGGFFERNYRIRRGRKVVARISKKWFSIRDTYGVEIEPGEDLGLILAVVVIIDEVTHSDDAE